MRYEVIVYAGNLEEFDRTAEIISADRAIAFIEAYEKMSQAARQSAQPTAAGGSDSGENSESGGG